MSPGPARHASAMLLLFLPAGIPLILGASPTAVRSRLVAVKARVMSADYRADLEALASLREEIEPLRSDPELGYLADYWSAYASWRLAMNGANHGISPEALEREVAEAVAGFESCVRRKPGFADGLSAASSVHGWLAQMQGANQAMVRLHRERAGELLKTAESLEPDNPRVIWVRAGFFLFVPPQYGGDPDRAIALFRRQADRSGPLEPDSPFPDWGKPEALMSLAYAHLNQPKPDTAAALREARAALRLEPRWSYVRDILIPQIDARSRQQ